MGRWTTTAAPKQSLGRRLQNSIIERSMDLAAFRACAALLKCADIPARSSSAGLPWAAVTTSEIMHTRLLAVFQETSDELARN